VEWCKAYSRSRRWGEEVELLTEEMRRCLVTLEFNAKEWEARTEYTGALAADKGTAHTEGVRAYALSQAGATIPVTLLWHFGWFGSRSRYWMMEGRIKKMTMRTGTREVKGTRQTSGMNSTELRKMRRSRRQMLRVGTMWIISRRICNNYIFCFPYQAYQMR
ncbi:hypothetical protein BT96DRAFT_822023, partial [Gymnopus androsaceus JB14]